MALRWRSIKSKEGKVCGKSGLPPKRKWCGGLCTCSLENARDAGGIHDKNVVLNGDALLRSSIRTRSIVQRPPDVERLCMVVVGIEVLAQLHTDPLLRARDPEIQEVGYQGRHGTGSRRAENNSFPSMYPPERILPSKAWLKLPPRLPLLSNDRSSTYCGGVV